VKKLLSFVLGLALCLLLVVGATATPAFATAYQGSTGIGTPVLTMPTPDQTQTQEPGKTDESSTQEQPTTTPTLKGFRDVAEDRWSHGAIMEMVGLGMFKGTEAPDANGMGLFDPEGTMSRAQLLAVVTRHLYADTLARMTAGQYWYSNNYTVALNNGIITESEVSADSLNDPITRQEMAMVMVRAALKQGETLPDLVPTSRIADYATIGTYYQAYVRQAFSMGLLAGYDDKGTFGPKDTLTREQGAMVVYRLVNMDSRVEVDYGDTSTDSPVEGAITIYEGQTRTNRVAQPGDIFVRANGTRITLQRGPSGVIGEGQGVAPDLGLIDSQGREVRNGGSNIFRSADFTVTKDSNGAPLNNQVYYVNKYTGEGHWQCEWLQIASSISKPPRDGTRDAERYTEDGVCVWVWNALFEEWECKPDTRYY